MSKRQWNAGDLVEVVMQEKLGWGDRHERYLVLVLGKRSSTIPNQLYPLTAGLEEQKMFKSIYQVMKYNGKNKLCFMGLEDWSHEMWSCTNRLVQSACAEN